MEDTKSFLKLKEYLDGRGKLVTNPAVTKSPDYTGPNPKAPVSVKADKNAGGSNKSLGNHAPYAPKLEKSQNVEKGGLAGKGNKAEPYPEPGSTDVEGKPVKSPWSKKSKAQNPYPLGSKSKMTKTESFLTKTKDMPVAEFMKYMYSECGMGKEISDDDDYTDKDSGDGDSNLPTVTAYTAGKFHPHPPEVIKYIAALAKANPRIMEMLIHEIKRQDGLGDLVSSTMDHPETYGVMSDLFGDDEEGPSRSKALVNSMDDKYQKFMDDQDGLYEGVAPPFGISHDDDEEDDDGTDDGDVDPDAEEGDDTGDDTEETPDGSEEAPEDGETDDVGSDDSEENPDDSKGDDAEVDPDAEPEENGTDGDIPPEDGEEPTPVPPKKLKKKFAHHHLINAMKNVGHMKDVMGGDPSQGAPSGM